MGLNVFFSIFKRKLAFKLGLALPKWLVEEDNNMLVLFLYALIFGLGLPFAVV